MHESGRFRNYVFKTRTMPNGKAHKWTVPRSLWTSPGLPNLASPVQGLQAHGTIPSYILLSYLNFLLFFHLLPYQNSRDENVQVTVVSLLISGEECTSKHNATCGFFLDALIRLTKVPSMWFVFLPRKDVGFHQMPFQYNVRFINFILSMILVTNHVGWEPNQIQC